MRKTLLLPLLFILVTPSLLAQDWRDRRGDRYDPYRNDNTFELTPFAGYRWGGTLKAGTVVHVSQDLDLKSSASFGGSFGIPLPYNFKLELMVDHQSTTLTTGSGSIFDTGQSVADMTVTYYHAGLQIPINPSRNATPYVIVSAGLANLDPKIAGLRSANRFSASVGGGVKVPINRNAGIRFEGRGFFTSLTNSSSCRSCAFDYSNRDLYQGEANLGIYFKF